MTDKNFDADGKIRTRVVSTMTLVKNLEGYRGKTFQVREV